MNKYYLYNTIPGAHHTWTLAVLATSQNDADEYMRKYNKGGKRAGVVHSGFFKADCGAVTAKAQQSIAENQETE